jgi:hypothetical protein
MSWTKLNLNQAIPSDLNTGIDFAEAMAKVTEQTKNLTSFMSGLSLPELSLDTVLQTTLGAALDVLENYFNEKPIYSVFLPPKKRLDRFNTEKAYLFSEIEDTTKRQEVESILYSNPQGGTNGLLSQLYEVSRINDSNRPYPDTSKAYVGCLVLAGAQDISMAMKGIVALRTIFGNAINTTSTENDLNPYPRNLQVKKFGNKAILTWENPNTVAAFQAYMGGNLTIQDIIIIRSIKGSGSLGKTRYTDILDDEPVRGQDLPSNDNFSVIYSGTFYEGMTMYTDDLPSDINRYATYYICYRSLINSETTQISRLSNPAIVRAAQPSVTRRSSQEHTWMSLPSVYDLCDPLKTIMTSLRNKLETYSYQLNNVDNMQSLNNTAIENQISKITDSINLINRKMAQLKKINLVNIGMYIKILYSETGGYGQFLNNLISSLSEEDAPPFDDSYYVSGVLCFAQAQNITELTIAKNILEMLGGLAITSIQKDIIEGYTSIKKGENPIQEKTEPKEEIVFDKSLRKVTKAGTGKIPFDP